MNPVVQRHLSPRDVEQVRELITAAQAEDGSSPLSDHVMLHLPGGGDSDVRHLLVHDEDRLVGYAHLDVTDVVQGSSAELVVHPQARGRGIGRQLAAGLFEASPDGRLRLWAHGEHPAAARMAAAGGLEPTRVLWQMRRSLDDPLPAYHLPEGVSLRTFVVGQDEPAWTEVNNRAFSEHPDQGGWSVEEVRVREREPWFDPEGFFLAERADKLVGFHWTKVHGAHRHHDGLHADHAHSHAHSHAHAHGGADPLGEHPHELIGEVYVVGVDPSEQGQGLGPALTLVGLHHLQRQGLPSVMLYVDETNTNAIRVYERLGFTRHAKDVCFSRRV